MIIQLFILSIRHKYSTRIEVAPKHHRFNAEERAKSSISFLVTLIFKCGQWIKAEELFSHYLWGRPIKEGKKERERKAKQNIFLISSVYSLGTKK